MDWNILVKIQGVNYLFRFKEPTRLEKVEIEVLIKEFQDRDYYEEGPSEICDELIQRLRLTTMRFDLIAIDEEFKIED